MTSSLGSRRRAVGAVLIALAVAVVAERERWFGRLMAATSTARTWIWVASAPADLEPRAFFLVRDFDLFAVPPAARLSVAGDPEYIVRLNGRRIGSATYRPGAPVDVYEVGEQLRIGRNRVVIESRSPIGSGGVTARLSDDADRTLVESDGEWSVYAGVWRALADLDRPLPKAPRAVVLGVSPLARWGVPSEETRPTYDRLATASELLRARLWRSATIAGPWHEVPRRSRRDLDGSGAVEIDFGRPVEGFLFFDLDRRRKASGMVFFSDQPGADLERSPDRVVVAVPHLDFWSDSEARRFRYATVVGIPSLRSVAVVPVRMESGPAPDPPIGLLGLPAEMARSPLVEKLRRELQAVDRPAG